jgi:hypothetical protein
MRLRGNLREYIRENGEGILDDCRGRGGKHKRIKEKKKRVLGSIKVSVFGKGAEGVEKPDVRTRNGRKRKSGLQLR